MILTQILLLILRKIQIKLNKQMPTTQMIQVVQKMVVTHLLLMTLLKVLKKKMIKSMNVRKEDCISQLLSLITISELHLLEELDHHKSAMAQLVIFLNSLRLQNGSSVIMKQM